MIFEFDITSFTQQKRRDVAFEPHGSTVEALEAIQRRKTFWCCMKSLDLGLEKSVYITAMMCVNQWKIFENAFISDSLVNVRHRDLAAYVLDHSAAKKSGTWSLLTWCETRDQKRFTISQVAADWHELMIPRRTMQPSISRASEPLDTQCSEQTHHRPNQSH